MKSEAVLSKFQIYCLAFVWKSRGKSRNPNHCGSLSQDYGTWRNTTAWPSVETLCSEKSSPTYWITLALLLQWTPPVLRINLRSQRTEWQVPAVRRKRIKQASITPNNRVIGFNVPAFWDWISQTFQGALRDKSCRASYAVCQI
jgi:hypothetical protein